MGNIDFLWWRADATSAFFFVAVVVAAGTLLGLASAMAVAVVSTAVILAATLSLNLPSYPIGSVSSVLVWLGAALAWASANPVHTALTWAWSSYLDALKKTEELRDQQGELSRVVDRLNETC